MEKLLGSPTFEELISPSQTVELQGKETKEVSFQLNVPKNGFEGTILGGFYCYELTDGKEKEIKGFSLTNKFAYTIGAKLVVENKNGTSISVNKGETRFRKWLFNTVRDN